MLRCRRSTPPRRRRSSVPAHARAVPARRRSRAVDDRARADRSVAPHAATRVRSVRRAPRLPDPRGARPRQAPRLARQRGDHAEAARGHRSAHVLLRARELEHPPRRAHARGARDRRLRGGARDACAASSTRRRRARSSSCAARPRASTSSRRAGAARNVERGRRDRHHLARAPRQHRAVAAALRREGRALRVAPVDDRGEVILEEYEKLLGPQDAARLVHRRSRTRSARSRRRAR